MTLARWVRRIREAIAVPQLRRAVIETAGLAMVFVGLWWTSPAAAMVTVGLAILVPSVLSTIMPRGRR